MILRRKKRNFGEDSGSNVGIVMTVSLFLILLTFFILLNSIAVLDERKVRVSIGSLIGAFGSLPGGVSALATGKSPLPATAPMTEEKIDVAEIISLMSGHIPGKLKVSKIKEGDIITVNGGVLFEKDYLTLRTSSYPLLNKLCTIINKGNYQIEIVGHTDKRPAEEKGFRSNWELSSLMAMQVLKYFLKEGKVSSQRLTAYGRGSNEPATSNNTRQSRAQNTRVDIVLHAKAPAYIKRIYEKKRKGFFTYKMFDFLI